MKRRSRRSAPRKEISGNGGRRCDDREPVAAHIAILSIIRQIPRGRVCTYGRVAVAAGLPRRARLVGRVLRASPLADAVPWHRVVASSGRISDRPGDGAAEQIRRLAHEGIDISATGRIDMGRYLWDPSAIAGRLKSR